MHDQATGSGGWVTKSFKVSGVLGIRKSLRPPRYSVLLVYNHSESIKFSNLPNPLWCVDEKDPRKGRNDSELM